LEGESIVATAEPDLLSIDEVRAGIHALTRADLARLLKAARYLAMGSDRNPKGLMNDAVCAALDGTRACRRDLPLTVLLIGVMKSQVWWAREQKKDEPVLETMDATGTDGVSARLRDPARDPEEMLLAKEDTQARLDKLEELFAGDEEAELVLFGELDDMSPSEIREQAGLDETQYATVRRRIRRKIEKAIGPGGWLQ
jgi:hypothetical protein